MTVFENETLLPCESVTKPSSSMPKSAYQNYLSELKEHYPVISAAELLDTGNEELLTYQRLQYYQLFDYDE